MGEDIGGTESSGDDRSIPCSRGRWNIPVIVGLVLIAALILCLPFLQPRHALALGEAQAATTSSMSPTDTAERTVVRVGYFYDSDYLYKDDQGAYRGYDTEYLYSVAGYAGWDVRFVDYDTLQECLDALAAGDIDVVTNLGRTAARDQLYLFSSEPMCTSYVSVMVRADDDRYTFGDPSSLTDARIGVLEGSILESLYVDWAHRNGFEPQMVECSSIEERNRKLADGEVDGVVAGSTIEGTIKVAQIPGLLNYFAFNSSRSDLKSQCDRAMSLLTLNDPTYATLLYQRYFPVSRNTTPAFSAREKQFIEDHPEIDVAVLADDAPYSFLDADGAVSGILPAYYQHLSELTGIRFVCTAYPDIDAEREALEAGDVQAIGMVQNDILSANAYASILSSVYLQTDMVQMTRVGTGSVETVGAVQRSSSLAYGILESEGSEAALQQYGSALACMTALKKGQVDAIVCSQATATWLLNRNRSSDYVISTFGDINWEASAEFPATDDGNLLRAIVNKAIVADPGYMTELLTNCTLEDSDNLASLVDRIPVGVLVGGIIMFLLVMIAAAAIIVLLRRRRSQAELARREADIAADARTNEAQHNFFSTVSLDMRTPLNGIVGFTELALHSDDPDKVRDYLDKIRTSGGILNDLVNDTLVMSRVESGKLTLSPVPCMNLELLDGIREPVRVLAEGKGVVYTDNVDLIPPRRIMADRVNTQKILLNLLSNAVKFTPEGGHVDFHISLDPPGSAEPDSILTVSDTGIGMDPDFLERAFEPFTQEDPGNAGRMGTGLGLSIVKSLVDAMGGRIEVTSSRGGGTVFTVRLHFPAAPAVAESPVPASGDDPGCRRALAGGSVPAAGRDADGTPAPDDVVASAVRRAPAGTRRVLVAEDNHLNAEISRALLEREGLEVTLVEDGRQAVEAFMESPVDSFAAVLLDLRMPVMDGESAARAIRALDRPDAGTIPVIAVSADAYPENIQRCVAAGMDGHIAKPVVPGELARVLAAHGVPLEEEAL